MLKLTEAGEKEKGTHMKKLRLLWMIIKRIQADKILYIFIAGYFLSALIITMAEPGIKTYGDGLWYTFVASTTIGFGDLTVTTAIGKIATVYVTVSQIIVISIVPGILVSYYMEVIHRREKETVTIFLDKMEHLPELSKEELREISEKVKKIK